MTAAIHKPSPGMCIDIDQAAIAEPERGPLCAGRHVAVNECGIHALDGIAPFEAWVDGKEVVKLSGKADINNGSGGQWCNGTDRQRFNRERKLRCGSGTGSDDDCLSGTRGRERDAAGCGGGVQEGWSSRRGK